MDMKLAQLLLEAAEEQGYNTEEDFRCHENYTPRYQTQPTTGIVVDSVMDVLTVVLMNPEKFAGASYALGEYELSSDSLGRSAIIY